MPGTSVPGPAAEDRDFAAAIARARAGDGRGFAYLYDRFHRPVHAFVRARCAADPEGVVNEAFFAAFRNIGDFEGGPGHFRSWVFRIARNRVIDEARRNARRPHEEPGGEAGLDPSGGDAEVEAVARLQRDWVLRQLARLTPEQRDVLLLRIVSDCTVESVAEILDKPVGAVKALQRRAFRTLARTISSEAVPL